MAELSGFRASLDQASEELIKQESLFKEAKTRLEREVLKNDLDATKKNITFYKQQIKVVEKHILLEHTEEEKARYGNRYDRNRRNKKVD